MSEFDILNSCDPEIFEAEDWYADCQSGFYLPYDGTAFWGTETHYNFEHCGFDPIPEGATHVHWFSK